MICDSPAGVEFNTGGRERTDTANWLVELAASKVWICLCECVLLKNAVVTGEEINTMQWVENL